MLNMRENFGAQIQTWWEKKRFSRGVSAKREMGKGFRWFEGRLAKILETIICNLYFYRIRIGNSSWEDSSTILHALNSSLALDWARHKQCTS